MLKAPTVVEHHTVDIYPPNEHRTTWLATCSQGDFSQSFLNRVEARVEGTRHYTDLMVLAELANGTYEFDDGRT